MQLTLDKKDRSKARELLWTGLAGRHSVSTNEISIIFVDNHRNEYLFYYNNNLSF